MPLVVYLWGIYGVSMGYLWGIYGVSMGYLWGIYGVSMSLFRYIYVCVYVYAFPLLVSSFDISVSFGFPSIACKLSIGLFCSSSFLVCV